MQQDSAAPRVRECPSCGATCPAQATICYACKKAMAEIIVFRQLSDDEVARIEAELRPLTDEADAPPVRRGQPSRIRRSTWSSALALFVLFFGIGVAVNAEVEALAGLLTVVLMGVLVGFVVALVRDLSMPRPRTRARSEQAVRCYFRAIRNRHWRAALACLSPMARERTVRVPHIASLRTRPIELVRSTPGAVKAYWQTICCRSGLNQYRRLVKIEVLPIATQGAVHRFRVGLRVHYGTLGLDQYRKHFEVVVYRHRSQWWIYGGEFDTPPAPGV